ncbi:unnamed protein product, partial [marine sediment metagenome]
MFKFRKKMVHFLILAMLVISCGMIYAAAPSYDLVDGTYQWTRDTVLASSGTVD